FHRCRPRPSGSSLVSSRRFDDDASIRAPRACRHREDAHGRSGFSRFAVVHAVRPMHPDRAAGLVAGKRALITGAAGDIGSATARALAAGGARVALVDLDADALVPLRDDLAGASGRPAAAFPALAGDVTDADAVRRYTDAAADAMGGLDVLFNNAGIEGPVVPLMDYPEEDYERVMRVNVRGVWLNLKRAVALMLQGGGGSIINMASGAALRGLPMLSGYVASK